MDQEKFHPKRRGEGMYRNAIVFFVFFCSLAIFACTENKEPETNIDEDPELEKLKLENENLKLENENLKLKKEQKEQGQVEIPLAQIEPVAEDVEEPTSTKVENSTSVLDPVPTEDAEKLTRELETYVSGITLTLTTVKLNVKMDGSCEDIVDEMAIKPKSIRENAEAGFAMKEEWLKEGVEEMSPEKFAKIQHAFPHSRKALDYYCQGQEDLGDQELNKLVETLREIANSL
ncbi:hypothetical protein ACFL21_03565 [Patescibacteria group bacterium]